MRKSKLDAFTFETHRMLTEDRLTNLLQDAESFVTIDKVKALIFEAEAPDFRTYVPAMLSALNCDNIDDSDDVMVQVIQEAWNYFPHRSLKGRCPAEVFAELARN